MTPRGGLDANILAHFLSNYEDFQWLFQFLENPSVTIQQKQQKFHDFEVFLVQCDTLTKNERKYALYTLGEMFKVSYSDFEAYRYHAELIMRFSRHG